MTSEIKKDLKSKELSALFQLKRIIVEQSVECQSAWNVWYGECNSKYGSSAWISHKAFDLHHRFPPRFDKIFGTFLFLTRSSDTDNIWKMYLLILWTKYLILYQPKVKAIVLSKLDKETQWRYLSQIKRSKSKVVHLLRTLTLSFSGCAKFWTYNTESRTYIELRELRGYNGVKTIISGNKYFLFIGKSRTYQAARVTRNQ